jgi:hypothetical protein
MTPITPFWAFRVKTEVEPGAFSFLYRKRGQGPNAARELMKTPGRTGGVDDRLQIEPGDRSGSNR